MDETEHMPRYTLTLVDSTGAMEPLILMDDDLKSIAAKLDMSMEEAHEAMDAMLADRAELGLPAVLVDPATVHRKH